jgi:hypothetical protein
MQRGRSPTIPETDGLLVAAIREEGVWGALCALRDGMRGLADRRPQTSFVAAMTEDGRLVEGQNPEARLLVLGYRTR